MARPYQVRSFDSLLKSRIKNPQMRQKIYTNLLTRLVKDERLVTTLPKCKDLSRLAERMIDLAKQGDEGTIYTWLNKKEVIPKVFGELLERFHNIDKNYTSVYKLPPRKFDSAHMGVIEFKGHKLPQLVMSEDQLQDKNISRSLKQQASTIPLNGTPV